MLDALAPYGQAITLIAAICVAFGAFLSSRNTGNELRARDAELRANNALLLERAHENARLQEELKTHAQETVRQVTGGNSYVRLILGPPSLSEEFPIIVSHGGERAIPAFDVNIFIDPTGKCDSMQTWTMRDVMSTGVNNVRRHYLPAVPPSMGFPLQVSLKPSCDDAYYLVVTYTRNRVTLQQIVLRKVDGHWSQATRVLDPMSGEELWKHVDGAVKAIDWPEIAELVDMMRALPAAQSPSR